MNKRGTHTPGTDFAGLLPEQLPDTGLKMYDIDTTDGTLKVVDHLGVVAPVGEFVKKYTVNFDDFVTSAQQETILLGLVPPGAMVKAIQISQIIDWITSGISTAYFRTEIVDITGTVQSIGSYNGTTTLKDFNANLAGVNSGVFTNDFNNASGIIFNRSAQPELRLTLGVDSKLVGTVIESIVTSRWLYDFTTVSGATLDGKYFTFATQTNEYYVWYNTGTSTDPTPGGFSGAPIGIEVSIGAGFTAAEVASATQQHIYAVLGGSGINVFSSANKFRIVDTVSGAALFGSDIGTSGFTQTAMTDGGVGPVKTIADLVQGQIVIHVIYTVLGY